MNQTQFEKFMRTVPSLFTQRHAHIIYGLIRWLNCVSALEVGTYSGYMTCWIAKAIKDNHDDGIVYAVDDFSLGTTAADLHNHLVHAEVADIVHIINANSQTIVDFPSHEFAFIDGDHSYDGVRTDVMKAALAGAQCIVLHDSTSWWGVNEFVTIDELEENYNKLSVGFDEGLTIYLVKPQVSPVTYTKEQYPKGHV